MGRPSTDHPVGSQYRQQSPVGEPIELLVDKIDDMTFRQKVLAVHGFHDQLREPFLAHRLLIQQPSIAVESGFLTCFEADNTA